ncbi:hypothetical protein MPH_06155 [Macrophomina phaseolina MS6]|uniref:Uncharacterized protein n=1 Tax=Macrophomina phaseolina (strain MS6) TaxID=1126212 RepID=K2S269_MACPH|nr:hypothetical protein MPH_06155 [Macrophomina phaseolina MS6]
MGKIAKEEATDAATALWEFVQWGKKLFTPLWPSIIDIFETLKRTVDGTCQLRAPDYGLWKRAGKDGESSSTWEPLDKNDPDPSLRLLVRLSAPGRYELTPWRRGTAAHMLRVIRDTDAYADPGSKSFLADLSQLEIVAGVMLLANRSRDDDPKALSRKITSLRDITKVDQQRIVVADKRINKFFAREAKARETILVPGMGDYARGYWFARFEELGRFGARNDHDFNKEYPDDVDEPAVIVPILGGKKRMAEVLEENRGGRPAAAPKWTMAPAPVAVADVVEGQVEMFEEPGIESMLLGLLWFHAHTLDAILAKGSKWSFAQSEDYFERHFRFLDWVVARRQISVRSKLDGLPEGDVGTAHAHIDLLQYEDISKAIANRKRLFESAKKWAYGRGPHDKQAGGDEDPAVEKRGANSESISEPQIIRARYVSKQKEELANKSPWEVLTRSLRDPSGLVLGKDEDGTKIALFTILMDEGGRKPWFDHTLSFWKSRLYAPAILANRLQYRPWRLPESEDTHELIADIYEELYGMAASKVQSGELRLPFRFPFEDKSLKRLPILEKEGSGSKKTVGDGDSASLTSEGLAGSLAPEKRRKPEQFSFLSHHPSEGSSWEATQPGMPIQLKHIQQLVDEEERELMNRLTDRMRASELLVDAMKSEDEVRAPQNGGIWRYGGIPHPPVQPVPSESRRKVRNSEKIRAPGARVDEGSTMSAERLRRYDSLLESIGEQKG